MWGRSSLLRELHQEALDARREEEAGGAQHSPRGGAAARRGAVSLLHDARHVRALTHSERLASSRFQVGLGGPRSWAHARPSAQGQAFLCQHCSVELPAAARPAHA